MKTNRPLVKGAAILTLAGISSRVLGFLYRIFLSNIIGAVGMGIFQLVVPIYILFVSFSSGGIQIAMSRFIAESCGDKKKNHCILFSGLVLTFAMSAFSAVILFFCSDLIAEFYLKEHSAAPLLRLIALAVPLTSTHSCIIGYYLGTNNTVIPAIAQILEQIFKIISLGIIMVAMRFINPDFIVSHSGMPAIIALVLSEFAGSVFLFISIKSMLFTGLSCIACSLRKQLGSLMSVSYILTLNKVTLTLLQSIEASLIPTVLTAYGISRSEALSQYGVLTGMALPVISFPSALIGSVAMVVMPAIARAKANGNKSAARQTSASSIYVSVILGSFCTIVFFIFNDFIGNVLFGEHLASVYIKSLCWICPFLYLSITLGSILHGLGKTGTAFCHNLISIIVRIVFIAVLVPKIGISGYLYGLMTGTIITVMLHGFVILKNE